MRGVRVLLESQGHIVTGSDLKKDGHSPDNITSNIDIVVRTSAVNPGSEGWVEIEAAKKQNILVKKRSEIIKELTSDKYLITISGMHGKTTVTSLIGLAMEKAGLDPTVLVGEEVREFGGVVRVGNSKYFVLEACEYDKSFLDFYPDIAVVTNLDLEHLDTFPNGWSDIMSAFSNFIDNIKNGGKLIYFNQDLRLKDIIQKARSDIEKISYDANNVKNIDTALLGDHNKNNISATVAVMNTLGVEDKKYFEVFKTFKGAKRRMEYKGEVNGMKVYDDYGHHPTEIRVTVKALRDNYPDKKILTVFWPHQFRRIESLKNEFVEVLSESDKVILKPIYLVPGRDEKGNVSSEDLVQLLNKNQKKAVVLKKDQEIVEKIKKEFDKDWIILTIGIPPIYKVADKLIEK